MTNKDILRVKYQIEKNLGRKITLSSKRGRTKISTLTGIIESTHPSIFTIKLDKASPYDASNGKLVSYSYTDILTRTIEIKFAN